MIRSRQFAGLAALLMLGSATIAAEPPADAPAPSAKQDPDAAFARLVAATNWPLESAARQELAAGGREALEKILNAVRFGEHDARVRRACFEVLTEQFAGDERAIEAAINFGLADEDAGIRYGCAFRLGEVKAYAAYHGLRRIADDRAADERVRNAAVKSLAQLGEVNVVRPLFELVSSDHAMTRSMGNSGLKALSGKCLDDFEGYNRLEGSFVSGGREAMPWFDAITVAEKKAGRYRALAAYFRWLKETRPDLYKYVTGSF